MGHGSARDLSTDLALHCRAFRERLGPGAGLRLFFSPGRVNLMGAHLDYNGGPVMPTAIDRGTFIAARPRTDERIVLASTLDGQRLEFDLGHIANERSGRWFDYPIGVLIEILELATDARASVPRCGLEILFGGNLPVGAGLSSSASICVGFALCLDQCWNLGRSRMDLVHAALRAERKFVGVQCGIMDPYAVGLARENCLLWLDCKDASLEYLPLDSQRFSIAVADTGVRRALAQGAFNLRVRQCEEAFAGLRPHQEGATCLRDIRLDVFESHRRELDPVVARRADHVIHEVARTFAARDALARNDPAGLGVEMVRAHESLRDLFEVSVPELDQLVASATTCDGVLGARLTGAGFGGCAVVLLRKGAEAELSRRLEEDFSRRFGAAPAVDFFGGDSGPRELVGAWDSV